MTFSYPLSSDTWGQEEIDAVQGVLRSRRFSMGDKVRAFEDIFAQHFGTKHAVMVNSGSSANLLAVAASVYAPDNPLRMGDEVLVPAVSWSTTYYPIHQLGLTLSFVDIDPDTLNIDLNKLEQSITPATRAIMAVNLLGNPNDFDVLQALCRKYKLILLEDNCESMGAVFGGKQAGTFGQCGTFSTFYSHHIATMEGGLIVTDNSTIYHTLVSLRAHGWTRGQPEDSHLRSDDDPFVNLFRFVLPGYNVRPLEMEAAIGIEQLKRLPGFIAGRRRNASMFQGLLQDNEHVRIQHEIGESSWFSFSLVLRGKLAGRRKDVVAAFQANGIECRPIVAGNFLRNPVIKHLRHVVRHPTPIADEIDREGFYIGNHHYPLDDQLTLTNKVLGGLIDKKGIS
jgi:CDP-4-dehydro-6-deoxyglucose reductase, E1